MAPPPAPPLPPRRGAPPATRARWCLRLHRSLHLWTRRRSRRFQAPCLAPSWRTEAEARLLLLFLLCQSEPGTNEAAAASAESAHKKNQHPPGSWWLMAENQSCAHTGRLVSSVTNDGFKGEESEWRRVSVHQRDIGGWRSAARGRSSSRHRQHSDQTGVHTHLPSATASAHNALLLHTHVHVCRQWDLQADATTSHKTKERKRGN